MDERQQQHKQIERTRLTIANARRELLGETPFGTMEELDDWQDLQAADLNSNDEETDFVIREGGQIMADMLELDRRTAALPAMGSPLTAKAQTPQASTEL